MDIGELKKMLKNSATVLILDNGEPSFVVVNYDTYRGLAEKGEKEIKVTNANGIAPRASNPGDLAGQAGLPTGRQEMELLERINKDILALKAQIEEEEKAMGTSGIDE